MEPVTLQDVAIEDEAPDAVGEGLVRAGVGDVVEEAVVTAVSGLSGADLPWPLRLVHVAIIVNLFVQCCYGTYQVFWVLQPPGTFGPMFGGATDIPFELMMARRMYALESWVAFLGLALYVGVTEVLPRRTR